MSRDSEDGTGSLRAIHGRVWVSHDAACADALAVAHLVLLLQRADRDGKHALHHVAETVSQLEEERLEHVLRLADGNHASGSRVIDAVVHVVDAARVDNLLARDGRTLHLPYNVAELDDRSVVLSATVQPHVRVGQARVVGQRLAVRSHVGAASDVLLRERLAVPSHGNGDGATHDLPEAIEESLAHVPSHLLEVISIEAIQLRDGSLELAARDAVLLLEQRHDRRDVLEVPTLQQLFKELAKATHSTARALGAVERTIEQPLEVGNVARLAFAHRVAERLVRGERGVTVRSNASAGHAREEGRTTEDGGLENLRRWVQEEFDILPLAELRHARVELRGDDHAAPELRVYRHDQSPGGGVSPVAVVLEAQDDELLLLHLRSHELLDGTRGRLLRAVLSPRRRGDESGRVDDREVRAVLVLDFHDNLLGPELLGLTLESTVLTLDVLLQLLERDGNLLDSRGRCSEPFVRDEVAQRLHARSVVLHVKSDRSSRLRSTTDVVELESHERLDECAFSVRLVPDDEDRRRVERLVEVLRKPVQVVVRLVQLLLAARGRVPLKAVRRRSLDRRGGCGCESCGG